MKPLTRLDDWEPRLAAYLLRVRDRQWHRARWDCARFVCGAVEAMTGHDPGIRLDYRTDLAALRRLRLGGGLTAIVDAAARPRGLGRIPPAAAGRGDLVAGEGDRWPWLGIHMADTVFSVLEGCALCSIPQPLLTAAWRLPHD